MASELLHTGSTLVACAAPHYQWAMLQRELHVTTPTSAKAAQSGLLVCSTLRLSDVRAAEPFLASFVCLTQPVLHGVKRRAVVPRPECRIWWRVLRLIPAAEIEP
jgi:hypothetical protein